jgi:hypothetical protein
MSPAAQNREMLKLELAAQVLRSTGEIRFVAHGASMVPAIFPGDVLLARHQPIASTRCGDVALWSRDGRFCAHRVVQCVKTEEESVVVTRGDALQDQDPAIGSEEEFLGQVYAVVRRGKQIDLARPQGAVSRAMGFLARHSDFCTTWLLRYNSLIWRLAGRARVFGHEQAELLECQ